MEREKESEHEVSRMKENERGRRLREYEKERAEMGKIGVEVET